MENATVPKAEMDLLTVTLGLGLTAILAGETPAPIEPADYPTMEAAFAEPSSARPAAPVTFRALWSDPAAYQGQLVVIRGRVARRFAQPPIGHFPALNEDWVFDDQQNPFCVVSFQEHTQAKVGDQVEFTGTFLRLAQYRAHDGERLAPVLAGAKGPARITAPPAPTATPAADSTGWDQLLAIILGLFVIVLLGLQHVRRPVRRRWPMGPAPTFLTDRRDADESLETSSDDA